jgi:hypothetical protein
MSPRILTFTIGAIVLLFGLGGLVYPDLVMSTLGYQVAPTATISFIHGEVRALYGGVMLVAGVFTLLSAADPRANQGRLLLIGAIWLGACGGRVFGIFADGNPGMLGWLSVVFEAGMGGALIYASQASGAAPAAAAPNQMTGAA